MSSSLLGYREGSGFLGMEDSSSKKFGGAGEGKSVAVVDKRKSVGGGSRGSHRSMVKPVTNEGTTYLLPF